MNSRILFHFLLLINLLLKLSLNKNKPNKKTILSHSTLFLTLRDGIEIAFSLLLMRSAMDHTGGHHVHLR